MRRDPPRRAGFTLIELIIVMSILIILALIMIGILNPQALIGKSGDARRKKDLYRIRVAFEDYYNDKGCYPTGYNFSLMECGGDGFAPWLNLWPCDIHGNHYRVFVEPVVCPRWYKVVTKLDNLNDSDIPTDWADTPNIVLGPDMTSGNSNYGISSSNIEWSDMYLDPRCTIEDSKYDDLCYVTPGCNSVTNKEGCSGDNCYAHPDCISICKVPSCGDKRDW